MVKFLRKFENRVIKRGRYNSILITKPYQITVIYFNFEVIRSYLIIC